MGTRLERLHATFGLDLRSLGLLRILLGGMILADLFVRSLSLRAHYTDEGILPVEMELRELTSNPGRFSFHMDSGELNLQVWLFGISALFAVTLLVGFYTRLSLIASVILMISVQNRNFLVETGGDYLLRLVCMWCIFLPLGARFSLDARAGRDVPHPSSPSVRGSQYFSMATAALLAQMFCVYFFSALHKSHPIWTEQHLAIHYALHIDSYDTWLGEVLREHLWLTKLLTRVTLGFEYMGPWAIFGAGALSLVPKFEDSMSYQGPLRTLAAFAFAGFHIGLGMTLSLGTFAWFASLIWVGLFPTYGWDQIDKWRAGKPIFDVEGDRKASERRGKPKVKGDSEEEKPIVRPPGVLRLLDRLESWGRFIEGPRPKRPPELGPIRARARWAGRSLADVAAAVLLFYTLLWNLRTLESRPYSDWIAGRDLPLPDARPLLNFVRIDQHWGLFAPYPRTTDGYFVILGKKANGQEIDYLRPDERVTWEKPDDVSESFGNFRWRKYFRDLRRETKRMHLRLYSDYVCRTYNGSHTGQDALVSVEIYFMSRKTRPTPGHYPTEKVHLSRHRCDQKEPTFMPRPSVESGARSGQSE